MASNATLRPLFPAAAVLVILAACAPDQGARPPARTASAPAPAVTAPTPATAPAPATAPGAVAGVPGPASGAQVVCRANYDFCVEVDGAYPPDARFYKADARGKYLVDIPSRSKGLLIDMPTRRVVSVPRASITPEAADGVVRVADPGPSAAPAYALAIEGSVLRFQTDSSKVRILNVIERAPLVGPISLEALVVDRPEYRAGMKAYSPDPGAIETLKKAKKAVEIEAYFGTWCPHCKIYMPKFLRAVQEAGNPGITLTLVGVPKGFATVQGPWQGKNIRAIPEIVVRYEGRELTRLVSHEGAVPETELAAILGAIR